MKDKLNWVFTLKLVGITAVILGHLASPFSGFIYSWHMPLFFMLSGFFITVTAPLNYLVKKDFNRLMVPYFIFSFIALIITALKLFLLGRPQLNYVNEVLSIIFWMDYEHLKNTYGFVLWFLP
ncbi:MAG: acyltransferase family protein, partial [Oceanisphaera sp.]